MSTFGAIYRLSFRSADGCYVGKTEQFPPERRIANHTADLRSGRHCNDFLQVGWDQYGERALKFRVIEVVRAGTTAELRQALHEREAYWCKRLRPAFNLRVPRGGRR